MRSKYAVKEQDGVQFKNKCSSSQVWKGILWGAELLRKGIKWEVRSGRAVAFWRDIWLERKPLSQILLSPVDEEEMETRVYRYWDHGSWWRWDAFAHHLPATTLVKLASMDLRSKAADEDWFVWEAGRGKFIVRTTYRLSMDWKDEEKWEGWGRIWTLGIQ